MSKIPQEAIEAAINQWGYWHHKNQLLVDRGDTPSDSEIDFEVEAWNAVKKLILETADAARAQGVEVEPVATDEAWEELCGYSDRTSPEEYPDMALITMEELASFMERAAPPAPQPTEREKALEEALRVLEKSATRVSEYGAVTGPQWSHLTGALLKARAALAGGEA